MKSIVQPVNDEPTLHSPRSPSGYHRWAHCLDSIHAGKNLPDVASPWAAQGTLFHSIMAALLLKPTLAASDFLNETRTIDGHEVVCDDEMVKHLEEGYDFVQEQPGDLWVEKRVTLGRWLPGEWGTTDVGLATPEEITILDWKYGAEPVAVEGNEQLQLYALGFLNWLWNRFEKYRAVRKVRLVIRQPRVIGGGGEWHISVRDLLDFGDEAKELHRRSFMLDNPRRPGLKTCRWCKAKLECKPHRDFVGNMIGAKFEDPDDVRIDLGTNRAMSVEQRSVLLLHWPMVKKWHEAIHSDALNDALKGRPVPGMKVIQGRNGARQWLDIDLAEKKVRRMLGDAAYKTELLSPTEIEKKLTKEEYVKLKGVVTQAEGKPVLVDQKEKGTPFETYDTKFNSMADKPGDK